MSQVFAVFNGSLVGGSLISVPNVIAGDRVLQVFQMAATFDSGVGNATARFAPIAPNNGQLVQLTVSGSSANGTEVFLAVIQRST